MFKWLIKIFTGKRESPADNQKRENAPTNKYVDEDELREKIREIMAKNSDNSELTKLLASDLEKRSNQKDDRGSASSPISSP